MGADDGYICQFARNTSIFWGARNEMELGACFRPSPAVRPQAAPRRMVSAVSRRRCCWALGAPVGTLVTFCRR